MGWRVSVVFEQLPVQAIAGANPFAALSLIVAPALLTNASSLLVVSTSDRLARAVDRVRENSTLLEAADPGPSAH